MAQAKRKILILVLAVLAVGILGTAFFYYTNESYLRLNGDETVTVGLNGVYEEPGAEARSGGEDVSKDVEITGSVDTSSPGEYTLEYRSGNFTAKRTVKVLDRMDPELTLEGDEHITMKLGEKFKEPGYTATDDSGNDITADVSVSDASLNKAGEQKIEYEVKDSKGSTTRVARIVTVEPNTDYDTPGLPICMYHYVYDENDPPADLHQRFGNYISAQALE